MPVVNRPNACMVALRYNSYRRFPLELPPPPLKPPLPPLKPPPPDSMLLISLSLRLSSAPLILPTPGMSTDAPPLFLFSFELPPFLSSTMPFSAASLLLCISRLTFALSIPLRIAMGMLFWRWMLVAPAAREIMRWSVVRARTRPSAKDFEWSFEDGSRRWDSVIRRWSSRSWERRVRESSGWEEVGVGRAALGLES